MTESKSRDYVIRRFRPEDREQMLELFEAVWGPEKGARFRKCWAWKFEHNPQSTLGTAVWVAEQSGRITGAYCTIPVRAHGGGRAFDANWSVDVMTHPKARNAWIFLKITRAMIEENEEAGVHVRLGIPNDNSGPLLSRRGWSYIMTVPLMYKSLSLWSMARRLSWKNLHRAPAALVIALRSFLAGKAKPSGEEAPFTISRVEDFDERMDTLFEKVCGDYDFIVRRDREYLHWRYVECPHRQYTILLAEREGELLGYIVLNVDHETTHKGYIVDLLAAPGPLRASVIDRLVGRAVDMLKAEKAIAVELAAMDAPYKEVLEGHGFSILPGDKFRGFPIHGNPGLKGEYEPSLRPLKKWFFTRGDADTDMV